MIPRTLRLLAAATALLAVAPAEAGAAASARGSFDYVDSPFFGVEESCTETTGLTSTACQFDTFVISPGKTALNFGGGACVGVFPAELRVTSPAFGELTVPGTMEAHLGGGHFAGRAVVGGQVVVADLSYSGPHCALPSIIPPTTHVNGTYYVLAAS